MSSQQQTGNVIAFTPRSQTAKVVKRSGSVVLSLASRRPQPNYDNVVCTDAWYHQEALDESNAVH